MQKVHPIISRKNRFNELGTKNHLGKSVSAAGVDIAAAALAGGLLAKLAGKPSFFLGGLLTVIGYYKNIGLLPTLGAGMMAAGLVQDHKEGVSAKDHALSFKETAIKGMYLDKVTQWLDKSSSSTNEPTLLSGIGLSSDSLDMSELDAIEQQVVSDAMEFQKKQGTVDQVAQDITFEEIEEDEEEFPDTI
ncbi:MAG: hypothetical protein JKX76_02945 [Colwellia sp.]|nr:hypothetical protein [Colwellia sp.]